MHDDSTPPRFSNREREREREREKKRAHPILWGFCFLSVSSVLAYTVEPCPVSFTNWRPDDPTCIQSQLFSPYPVKFQWTRTIVVVVGESFSLWLGFNQWARGGWWSSRRVITHISTRPHWSMQMRLMRHRFLRLGVLFLGRKRRRKKERNVTA